MSTVPEALVALRDLFAATFNPDDVHVEFGPRGVPTTAGGRLRVGRLRGKSEPEALGPTRPMQEIYDVQCILSFTANGLSQEQVTLQVLAWVDVAEFAVRASPDQNIGVAGVRWAVVMGDFELTHHEASETGGPLSASFAFEVHVEALYRLT